VLAFNILYFLEDMENVIHRIHILLKPKGFFISATDCLGENRSIDTLIETNIKRLGFIPYIRKLTTGELQGLLRQEDFL